jgi:hypothetical protein
MWNNFFHETNKLFNQNEICDCCRKGKKMPHQENRYYRSGDIRVSFIQAVSNHSVRGVADPSLGASFDELQKQASWCHSGVCDSDNTTRPKWDRDLVQVMRDVVQPLRPDVLLWSSDTESFPSCAKEQNVDLDRILNASNLVLDPQTVKMTWSRTPDQVQFSQNDFCKSCFGGTCGGHCASGAKCNREDAFSANGWNTMDRNLALKALYQHSGPNASKSEYVDNAHQNCHFNNELVNLFLNYVCAPPL